MRQNTTKNVARCAPDVRQIGRHSKHSPETGGGGGGTSGALYGKVSKHSKQIYH